MSKVELIPYIGFTIMSCVAFYYWCKYRKAAKHHFDYMDYLKTIQNPKFEFLEAKKIIEANGYHVVANAIEIKNYTDIQL